MKKRSSRTWKIILLVLVLIVAVAAVGVFYFLDRGKNTESYRDYEKKIVAETEEAAQRHSVEVEQITQEVIDGLDETQRQVLEKANDEKAVSSMTQEEKTEINQKKEEIVAELKAKYYSILNSQKQEAIGMVDSLVSQAKADYQGLKASGGNTPVAKGNLVSEYMAKVTTMESQMDKSFESTVKKMEEQMKQNGIDPTAIVAAYRAEYKAIKEANRSAFYDKALAAVKGK